MKPERLAPLLAIARCEFQPATCARRNARNRITPKSPEVTPLRPLRPKNDKGGNAMTMKLKERTPLHGRRRAAAGNRHPLSRG
jgi:hypothetical protein